MDKIKRLQKVMPDTMEAAIFRDPSNRFYLTGMRSSAGTVVVTKKHAWLIIDFRYFEDAEKKVKNCIVIEETALYEQIRGLLLEEGVRTLSIHSGLTSLEEHIAMTTVLYPVQIDISSKLHKLIETLRMEEDEEEIACHRKAQQIDRKSVV